MVVAVVEAEAEARMVAEAVATPVPRDGGPPRGGGGAGGAPVVKAHRWRAVQSPPLVTPRQLRSVSMRSASTTCYGRLCAIIGQKRWAAASF